MPPASGPPKVSQTTAPDAATNVATDQTADPPSDKAVTADSEEHAADVAGETTDRTAHDAATIEAEPDVPATAAPSQTTTQAVSKSSQKMRPATAVASWPNWLGPERNGISRESSWSANWPASGPPVAWRAEIGTGFSAVSVDQGRVYTMGYRGGEDVVYCFDTANGNKYWEHSYPCELVDNLHEGGPGATPTVVGDVVYTLSREGHLHCLSADDGGVKWLREFKREIGAIQPDWGFTSSPYLLGNLLLVDVGCVVAVDRTSGEIIWKSAQHRAGYGTVVDFENAGRRLVAVFNNDGLFVLGANDGREVASYPLESQFATTSTTPIVSGDTLFVSIGYGGGGTLLKLSGNQLDRVYANNDMGNHFNNCVLFEGHLYGFDGNSHVPSQVRLVCMEHATGEVKWHQRGFGCGSLMIANGKLIVLSDTGTLSIAKATPVAFEVLAQAEVLDGRCWTMPVLAGGRIYCRNATGNLVCLDVRQPQQGSK